MRTALTEALIADPRNDDHAIISQLTALFAQLHNGLIDLIRRREPANAIAARFNAPHKRFLCARDALTAIYQGILRKDVMRRVIHPAIHAAYALASPRLPRLALRFRRRLGDSVRILARRVFGSVTRWCGRSTASTICRPTTSTTRWRRTPPTTRQHAARRDLDDTVVRASSRSTDRGRTTAAASALISATGSATTRSSRRSTPPSA
jgi:hypothetical protein